MQCSSMIELRYVTRDLAWSVGDLVSSGTDDDDDMNMKDEVLDTDLFEQSIQMRK